MVKQRGAGRTQMQTETQTEIGRQLQSFSRPQQVHTSGAHIYFAIKTCAKFHKERIPIIERTWASDAGARQQRKYYSDVAGKRHNTERN